MQEALQDESDAVAALGMEAMSLLCEADTLDFYAAWRVVQQQFPTLPSHRPLLAQRYFTLQLSKRFYSLEQSSTIPPTPPCLLASTESAISTTPCACVLLKMYLHSTVVSRQDLSFWMLPLCTYTFYVLAASHAST